MPFALLTIAILLIVSGARGTYPELKALLISDFTGKNNFLKWIVAIGAVGMIGYVPQLEKFSRLFLALIVVSIFLSQRGFFTKFSAALDTLNAGAPVVGDALASGTQAPETATPGLSDVARDITEQR